MIIFNGAKDDIFRTLDFIDNHKKLSIGAKMLASYLLRKYEGLTICWKVIAKTLNVSYMSVMRWKKECENEIFKISSDEKGQIIITFLDNNLLYESNNLLQDKEKNLINESNNLLYESNNLLYESNNLLHNKEERNLTKKEEKNSHEFEKTQKENSSKKIKIISKTEKAFLEAKEYFEKMDLNFFDEKEQKAILEFFVFRVENKRKSPFSQSAALYVIKQMTKAKETQRDIIAIIERCIANGWVGFQWGENELYKTKQTKFLNKKPLIRIQEHNYIVSQLEKQDKTMKFLGFDKKQCENLRVDNKKITKSGGFFSFVEKKFKQEKDKEHYKSINLFENQNIQELNENSQNNTLQKKQEIGVFWD